MPMKVFQLSGYSRVYDHLNRSRFIDVIATNLNCRRAIRRLVVPALAELLKEVRSMQAQVERIELGVTSS